MTQYLPQESLALLLLRAFLLGLFIGAVYSLFGIRRAAFVQMHIPRSLGAILLHLEDFLICSFSGVLLSVLYFATTGGVFRLMAIPALVGGLILWRITAGRLIAACTQRILHLLATLCRWMFRHILSPIGRAVRGRVFCLHRWLLSRRERRLYRRLDRKAARTTLRYRAELLRSTEQGKLPTPDLRKNNTKRRSKRSIKE